MQRLGVDYKYLNNSECYLHYKYSSNMKTVEIIQKYKVYTLSELSEEIKKLFAVAETMLSVAYAPYSNFQVAAALSLEDGTIHKGCNQENASYPLCMCAERVALYSAGAIDPRKKIEKLVIIAKNPEKAIQSPVSPCGACRQVISEFEDKQSAPIEIYLKGETEEIYHLESAKVLLPLSFTGDVL